MTADLKERDGYYRLCNMYRGRGELSVANSYCLLAAEKGHVLAIQEIVQTLSLRSVQRWLLLDYVARQNLLSPQIQDFPLVVEEFVKNGSNDQAVYIIGRIFSMGKAILRSSKEHSPEYLSYLLNMAVDVYRGRTRKCVEAVYTWSFAGIRLGLPKDMRVMVAKLIWGFRSIF